LIQANAAYPAGDEARILPSRDATVWPASALEQIVSELLLFGLDIGIHCFTGLFRHFELHRMSGLALTDPGPIRSQPARNNVFDLEAYNVASSRLAVDCEIRL
jgi:hypothetical protein